MRNGPAASCLVFLAAISAAALGLAPALTAAAAAPRPDTAAWNQPREAFRIWGNTYYVGTQGLGSVLIASDWGHVLIDGGLPQSAPLIVASIEKLGFKITDVKAILNSHVHGDHAGGIAELQKRSGAKVYVRRPSEPVLRTGKPSRDDPQFAARGNGVPPVQNVWVVHDEQILGVGSNRLNVVATPGHTPGGTSWAWESCEGDKCLKMVYADSLDAVSADKFLFTRSKEYPQVLTDFEQSFKKLEALPCEVMIPVHPDAAFFERMQKREEGKPESVRDADSCKRYVQGARERLAERVASEKS